MGTANVLTTEDLNFCKQFGSLLVTKRKELNLSQERLAKKAGLSRQVIQTWESGKTRISLRNTFKLVDAGVLTFECLRFGLKERL